MLDILIFLAVITIIYQIIKNSFVSYTIRMFFKTIKEILLTIYTVLSYITFNLARYRLKLEKEMNQENENTNVIKFQKKKKARG